MEISLREQLQRTIDSKTKPLGALGKLEQVALQVGMIQNSIHPRIISPHIVVFAGDHGIAQTGLVNPYPQEVTAQMALNFVRGGAAINVFCRQHNLQLKVVDSGINADMSESYTTSFINAKVARGTKNYLDGHAITYPQVVSSLERGRQVVRQIVLDTKCNCIGFGEMGIGNTSSASLIMSSMLGRPVAECVGRGTGVSDAQLEIKKHTLEQVFAFHDLQSMSTLPYELLSKVGGYEIAQMVGAYLQALEEKMIIVVDGFIATAALLLAYEIMPSVLDNCIFSHVSNEQAHLALLNHLKGDPLLNLGLRLGEGTGAALAMPLVHSAVLFLNQMASFNEAAVSTISE